MAIMPGHAGTPEAGDQGFHRRPVTPPRTVRQVHLILPKIDMGLLDVRESRQLLLKGLGAPNAGKRLDAERLASLVGHLVVARMMIVGHGASFPVGEAEGRAGSAIRAQVIIPR
jgi:hypothetical protein